MSHCTLYTYPLIYPYAIKNYFTVRYTVVTEQAVK